MLLNSCISAGGKIPKRQGAHAKKNKSPRYQRTLDFFASNLTKFTHNQNGWCCCIRYSMTRRIPTPLVCFVKTRPPFWLRTWKTHPQLRYCHFYKYLQTRGRRLRIWSEWALMYPYFPFAFQSGPDFLLRYDCRGAIVLFFTVELSNRILNLFWTISSESVYVKFNGVACCGLKQFKCISHCSNTTCLIQCSHLWWSVVYIPSYSGNTCF